MCDAAAPRYSTVCDAEDFTYRGYEFEARQIPFFPHKNRSPSLRSHIAVHFFDFFFATEGAWSSCLQFPAICFNGLIRETRQVGFCALQVLFFTAGPTRTRKQRAGFSETKRLDVSREALFSGKCEKIGLQRSTSESCPALTWRS